MSKQKTSLSTSSISNVLSERKNTHGDFKKGAEIEQQLKDIFRKSTNWDKIEPYKKITLDLIALKISRILEGDSDFKDHWDDINGYVIRTLEVIENEGKINE